MCSESSLGEAGDACEDFVSGFDPGKGTRCLIVDLDVFADCLFKLGDVPEGAPADPLFGDPRKPALDEVEPGAVRWREVRVEAGSLGEPGLDEGRLVRAVVIHDQVDVQVAWHRLIQGVQKLPELHRAVTPVNLAKDLSRLELQRRKEGRDAMAGVVVASAFRLPGPHGQDGLGPVQCLDLRLLIHAEHHRVVRRVHVEPDNISHLLDEEGVGRQLEALHPMGLKAEGVPDAADGHVAHSRGSGHISGAPVRASSRRTLQSSDHDVFHRGIGNRARASRPRFVVQPLDTVFHEPRAPKPYGLRGHPRLSCNGLVVGAASARQYDASATRELRKGPRPVGHGFQGLSFLIRQDQCYFRAAGAHGVSPFTHPNTQPLDYIPVIPVTGH
jgi:hypothetical protein